MLTTADPGADLIPSDLPQCLHLIPGRLCQRCKSCCSHRLLYCSFLARLCAAPAEVSEDDAVGRGTSRRTPP